MNDNLMLQVGVKVLLKNKEDKYLLLKRSSVRYKNLSNMWDIPGGRIIPGTSLLENLRREVQEETGLEIEGIPELLKAQDILRPDKHIVRLTFKGNADGTPVLKNTDEEEDYRWLTLDELKSWEGLDEYTSEVLKNLM